MQSLVPYRGLELREVLHFTNRRVFFVGWAGRNRMLVKVVRADGTVHDMIDWPSPLAGENYHVNYVVAKASGRSLCRG